MFHQTKSLYFLKNGFIIIYLYISMFFHFVTWFWWAYFHQEFNAGLFDYLIATDISQSTDKVEAPKENIVGSQKSRKYKKLKLDSEFGVVRGIDFKNVYTVCMSSLICLSNMFFVCYVWNYRSAYVIIARD
jgi:hypothetical protein